jgi:hypothetical protein
MKRNRLKSQRLRFFFAFRWTGRPRIPGNEVAVVYTQGLQRKKTSDVNRHNPCVKGYFHYIRKMQHFGVLSCLGNSPERHIKPDAD